MTLITCLIMNTFKVNKVKITTQIQYWDFQQMKNEISDIFRFRAIVDIWTQKETHKQTKILWQKLLFQAFLKTLRKKNRVNSIYRLVWASSYVKNSRNIEYLSKLYLNKFLFYFYKKGIDL